MKRTGLRKFLKTYDLEIIAIVYGLFLALALIGVGILIWIWIWMFP